MKVSVRARYSCVILDDDLAILNLLENYVHQVGKLFLKGSFSDPVLAMAAFQHFEFIDFIFLDIQMDVSGIDLARMLKKKVRYIVFISGFDTYALKAFEHGDSYLLKPISFESFLSAINRLITNDRRKCRLIV